MHGSTNSWRESVNLELPKLLLKPNAPQPPMLETASHAALWLREVSVCSWTLVKIYFMPSHKLKMAVVFVGSCSWAFLVLWWYPCMCLGMVTTLGHTHLGLLLHLGQCLREFHEPKQAGLAMQWGMLSSLDRQNTFSWSSPPIYVPSPGSLEGFSMFFIPPEKWEKQRLWLQDFPLWIRSRERSSDSMFEDKWDFFFSQC